MFGKPKPPSKPSTSSDKARGTGILDPKLVLDKPVEFETDAYDRALESFARQEKLEHERRQIAQQRQSTRSLSQQSHQNDAIPFANALIAKLPSDLSVVHLYADFPHVLNKIAMTWGDHESFYRLMDDLLIDKRGGRAGFPFASAIELSRLAEHYEQYVSRRPVSQWDVVQSARKPLY